MFDKYTDKRVIVNEEKYPVGTTVRVWTSKVSTMTGDILEWDGDFFSFEKQDPFTLDYRRETGHVEDIAYVVE